VVKEFIDNTDGEQVLPLGYGVNVNIPDLDSDEMPPVVQTRLTGDANVDVAVYDEETKLFDWDNIFPVAAGVNACYNGDCQLPGETFVVGGGSVGVSVFTIDYDAPSIPYTDMVFGKVAGLFASSGNSTGYKKRSVVKRSPGKRRMLTGRDVRE
jgi:5'-nucleotidase